MKQNSVSIYSEPSRRRILFMFVCVLLLAIVPLLPQSDFNTKGEPREAVVAMSMLQQNDWILPRNNGGEIPYKPPMFHWLVAASSVFTGGEVGEFASRFPSAIALVVLAGGTFAFIARRSDSEKGLLSALLLVTSSEVWRAGTNCRVDMLLTLFIVGAIYYIYQWWERGMRNLPWMAILLMSAGTLTKGPVGIILPCLVAGVFMLLRGRRFFEVFIRLCLAGVLALILPACWYAAAWHKGGEEFIALVIDENFGRMTGTMTYDVHSHAWPYNIVMLLAGLLPWTLIFLLALFAIKKKEWREGMQWLRENFATLLKHMRQSDPLTVICGVAASVIFIFYCIPKGKRGVYLLPAYPFICYFATSTFLFLSRRMRKGALSLGYLLASIAALEFMAFIASLFVAKIPSTHTFGSWIWSFVALGVAIGWWRYGRAQSGAKSGIYIAGVALCIYMSAWGTFMPAVMAPKSARPVAEAISSQFPDSQDAIYEFIADAEEAAGDPIHFFELNFYLGDQIRNFRKERPSQGYLIISDEDAGKFFSQFEKEGYKFSRVYTPDRKVMKRQVALYLFSKADNTSSSACPKPTE